MLLNRFCKTFEVYADQNLAASGGKNLSISGRRHPARSKALPTGDFVATFSDHDRLHSGVDLIALRERGTDPDLRECSTQTASYPSRKFDVYETQRHFSPRKHLCYIVVNFLAPMHPGNRAIPGFGIGSVANISKVEVSF